MSIRFRKITCMWHFIYMYMPLSHLYIKVNHYDYLAQIMIIQYRFKVILSNLKTPNSTLMSTICYVGR